MTAAIAALPTVAWITPTYRRPQTLANLIACFLAQDYPADLLSLLILDDAGQYGPACRGDRWEVVSITRRFTSLPAKFNAAVALTDAEILIVAEDDDTFLPHHTSAHVDALRHAHFSKPSQVLSDYPGHLVTENAAGRFHGSIAFRRKLWEQAGGWPLTHQANFDQQMMTHFAAVAGTTADPCAKAAPSYVFRWRTGHYHGQSFADGPGDQHWYAAAKQDGQPQQVERIEPRFDDFTQWILNRQSD